MRNATERERSRTESKTSRRLIECTKAPILQRHRAKGVKVEKGENEYNRMWRLNSMGDEMGSREPRVCRCRGGKSKLGEVQQATIDNWKARETLS